MFPQQPQPQPQSQAVATPPTTAPISMSTATKIDPNQQQSQGPEARKASHSGPHALTARSCITCQMRQASPMLELHQSGNTMCLSSAWSCASKAQSWRKVVSEREAELLKRLRRLEGVVEELSGQVEVEAVKQSPASDHSFQHKDIEPAIDSGSRSAHVRVVGMDEGTGTKKEWISRAWRIGSGPPKTAFISGPENTDVGMGRLVVDEGKSRYVSHPFWSQITDEVEEIREMLADQDWDSDSDTPILPSAAVTESNHQSFIMGYNSSDVDIKSLHPLPSQIPFYWQTFLENVHPLVKLLHAPTMTKTIKDVQNNMDSLSKSTEALMFAIYFATITSMNGTEVKTNFGVSKALLLNQYRFGTEQALAKAGLLNTNEIVTVQAFVLFLVCVRRHDDTRFVWSMTGLAIRISQALGLHRDGSKFGLPPFDTEMRRRLWWQVCILDIRASEDHGSDPSILDYSFDTELPISCNDEDLDPNDTEPPIRRHGVSEMTFCLIRYEICFLTRQLSYVAPGNAPYKTETLTIEDKEKLVRDTANHLEETYLQYCEDAGPLYWVAATVARLITAKFSLIIYSPLTSPGKPKTLSQDTRDRLFMATWRTIDTVFKYWDSENAHGKSGMLWKPLKKLMARAQAYRARQDRAANNTGNNIGMDESLITPSPSGYPSAMPTRDRLMPHLTDTTKDPAGELGFTAGFPFQLQADAAMAESVGIGMLAHGQMQQQFQQQATHEQTWLTDDGALADLEMAEGDVNWEAGTIWLKNFQRRPSLWIKGVQL
ncbi:Bikaverin cluster transcription factor [Lachnellula subtilissima]|uniref:Bikaverin cluster transcription factor n=1 Tax=Lachnellula subtilissima TaxID=602034 RepID=A0A8H8UGN3_9HELO|nr:Bikaverin cluster transcription factor [Lachnellula subtilissima]